MRRVLLIGLLTCVVVAGAAVAMGAGESDDGSVRYTIELDNAFGLIEGGDVKVAGVRAGKIAEMNVDRESYRALVDVEISREGYTDLRSDVFCESRPQSLIGEYFIDCLPGTAEERLEPGSRIPVEQTGSTVPPDLIATIWRRPTRERFSILLGELGAALAGRGEDLNETIRRANPALRETDKVLAALADERATIRDLTATAEDVVTRLADNRENVSRFIREARDTSAVSAVRQAELRAQFQAFPTFLRELRPTMRLLGQTADAQRPALAVLAAESGRLEAFFNALGPFSEASLPAMQALARAARAGRPAIESGTPRIAELAEFANDLPELADNLDITLNHLHDPRFTTEEDPRSPRGGTGYTGFEAILRYVWAQSQAVNTFDKNSHLLKVSAFLDNNCAQYAVAETARRPDRQYCRAILGPNQPGIDQPDPTADGTLTATRAEDDARRRKGRRGGTGDGNTAAPESPEELPDVTVPGTETPDALPDALKDALSPIQDVVDQVDPRADVTPLLDFLLRP